MLDCRGMTKPKPPAEFASYTLRDMDPKLWANFKRRAAANGRSLRWILVQLIQRYIQHGIP